MSSAASIADAWQFCADFYRRLSKTRGWANQAVMLEFVERIAPLAIEEKIYPSSSQEILILAYQYCRGSPCVCLWCWGAEGRFSISWSAQWGNAESVKRIDDALWQRIVAWLQTNEHTA